MCCGAVCVLVPASSPVSISLFSPAESPGLALPREPKPQHSDAHRGASARSWPVAGAWGQAPSGSIARRAQVLSRGTSWEAAAAIASAQHILHSSIRLLKPALLTPKFRKGSWVNSSIVFLNMQFYSCFSFPGQRGQWSRGIEGEFLPPQKLNIGTRQALFLPIQGEKSGSASDSYAQHFFRNLSWKQAFVFLPRRL